MVVYMPINSAKILPTTKYALNSVNLKIANAEKDLGVWIDNELNFEKRIINKVIATNESMP